MRVAGQICSATSRLLVHQPIAKKLLARLVECARAIPLAALVATIVGAVAFVAGGLLEWVAPRYFPTEVSWGLRPLWHVACAFGAGYCLFLRRLLHVLPA